VDQHQADYLLHKDLLRLRREDAVISKQGANGLDGAVLSESCLVIRYFSPTFEDDRLLVVNLGTELRLDPAPEPLLGPPAMKRWTKLWSSEDARYGGCGTAELDSDLNWIIPGQAALVLQPILISHEESI
jgi:maltooligosyltrehalose trehalohydrolase